MLLLSYLLMKYLLYQTRKQTCMMCMARRHIAPHQSFMIHTGMMYPPFPPLTSWVETSDLGTTATRAWKHAKDEMEQHMHAWRTRRMSFTKVKPFFDPWWLPTRMTRSIGRSLLYHYGGGVLLAFEITRIFQSQTGQERRSEIEKGIAKETQVWQAFWSICSGTVWKHRLRMKKALEWSFKRVYTRSWEFVGNQSLPSSLKAPVVVCLFVMTMVTQWKCCCPTRDHRLLLLATWHIMYMQIKKYRSFMFIDIMDGQFVFG